MSDLNSNISVALAFKPASTTADASGEIVDLRGAGSATVVINTGAATGGFVASLVHGDDSGLSDAAAVGSTDLLGTFPSSLAANSAYSVGYCGGKRYVRLALTKGSATSVVVGAVVVKGDLDLSGKA